MKYNSGQSIVLCTDRSRSARRSRAKPMFSVVVDDELWRRRDVTERLMCEVSRLMCDVSQLMQLCIVVERPLRRRRCQLAVHRHQRASSAAVKTRLHLCRRSFQLAPVNNVVGGRVTGTKLDTLYRRWTARHRATSEHCVVWKITTPERGGSDGSRRCRRPVGDRRQVPVDIRALSGRPAPLTDALRSHDVVIVRGPGHVTNMADILRLMTSYETWRGSERRGVRVRRNAIMQHSDDSDNDQANSHCATVPCFCY